MSVPANTTPTPKTVAREYFRRLDSGDPTLIELFDPHVTFYFPKYGIGRGADQLLELLGGLGGIIASICHDMHSALVLQSGDQVVVEGTSKGELPDGRRWAAGETPGGRFCDVFDVRDGKIVRLFVYLDPDYGGDDEARFLWGREGRRW